MEFFIDTEMPRTTRVTENTIPSMRVAICLVLVACGSHSAPPPRSGSASAPVAALDAGTVPVDAAVSIQLLTPTTREPRLEAPHGGSITDLAVTTDGTAAVTSDDLGGHRLWPTLDGQYEPRVIELPAPSQLAIARDPRGFLIALIDEAGGLVLQLVDRDGALLSRATLPLEPTFKGLAMTERGTLAWRSDQRIVRLAADGATVAQLATEQGQRVLHVAVPATAKADRAIAVIEGSTDTTTWRRARFLSIGDKLAWGSWIPAGDAVEPNLAVSPDLTRFGYLSTAQGNVTKVTVHDVADGKAMVSDNVFNALAIEMPDADHVVYSAANGQTVWIDVTTPVPRKTRNVMITQSSSAGVLASGGGKSFNPNGTELAISDAAASKFLGYALPATQLAAAADRGQLAITYGDRAALLDDKLRAEPMRLFPTGHNINALRWLTGETWLAQAVKLDTATTILALVEGATRTEVRTNQPAGQLSFEPSTKLVGVSSGVAPEVYRLVGTRLESVAQFPKPPPYDRVMLYPVSPALAGGTQVIVAHAKDASTVRWVADPRALDKGPTIAIDGAVVAVDVTGKVYAWTTDGKGVLELALLRDGKRLGALAVDKGTRGVWPDGKGERVLVAQPKGLTMYAADGTPVWTKPIAGVTQAVWLADGAIAAITGPGILRLDDKGELQIARCAWLFELGSAPHPGRVRGEPMCTKR